VQTGPLFYQPSCRLLTQKKQFEQPVPDEQEAIQQSEKTTIQEVVLPTNMHVLGLQTCQLKICKNFFVVFHFIIGLNMIL